VPVPAGLGDHPLYACPRWLHLLAAGGRPADAYLTDVDDRPAGLLPLHLSAVTGNARYAAAHLTRGVPGADPAEVFSYGGAMSAYQLELPVVAGADPRRAVAGLVGAAQRTAAAAGRRLVLPYLTARAAATLPAELRGRLVLEEVEAWLDVPGTLDDFQAAVPGRRRRKIARNLRLFAESGLRAATEPLAGCLTEFVPLVCAVSLRQGQRDEAAGLTAHLRGIADAFGDDAVVHTARTPDGVLVGGALAIRHGDTGYLRMSGFDDARVEGAAAYFELAFYQPMRQPAGRAVRALHFGMGTLQAKLLHGATPRPLWTLLPHDLTAAGRHEVGRGRLAAVTADLPEVLAAEVAEAVRADPAWDGAADPTEEVACAPLPVSS
jgi:hypothetical protein